jgi:hypothetical protein
MRGTDSLTSLELGHGRRQMLRRYSGKRSRWIHGSAEAIEDDPFDGTDGGALGIGIVPRAFRALLHIDEKVWLRRASRADG